MPRFENQRSVYRTFENYLEAILIIEKRQGYVRSADIATQLAVSQPSVSYSVKRLIDRGFLIRDPNRMLFLTDIGRSIAEQTYNRHKKPEKFFVEIGVCEKTACKDASNRV